MPIFAYTKLRPHTSISWGATFRYTSPETKKARGANHTTCMLWHYGTHGTIPPKVIPNNLTLQHGRQLPAIGWTVPKLLNQKVTFSSHLTFHQLRVNFQVNFVPLLAWMIRHIIVPSTSFHYKDHVLMPLGDRF